VLAASSLDHHQLPNATTLVGEGIVLSFGFNGTYSNPGWYVSAWRSTGSAGIFLFRAEKSGWDPRGTYSNVTNQTGEWNDGGATNNIAVTSVTIS